jgi:hypothetical protein
VASLRTGVVRCGQVRFVRVALAAVLWPSDAGPASLDYAFRHGAGVDVASSTPKPFVFVCQLCLGLIGSEALKSSKTGLRHICSLIKAVGHMCL